VSLGRNSDRDGSVGATAQSEIIASIEDTHEGIYTPSISPDGSPYIQLKPALAKTKCVKTRGRATQSS